MNKTGQISTYLAAAVLFVFGAVYLIRNEFMPYHAEAVGLSWSELEEPFQILFMAGMKIAAFGFLATSCAIGFLQYQFQKNQITWIPGLILFLGTMSFAGSMSAIIIVKLNTAANPPIALAAIAFALIIFGFLSNQKIAKNHDS